MGLIDKPGKVEGGEIIFEGVNLLKKLRTIRGAKISMIFQDPYSSLNPRWKVGKIIAEPLKLNTDLSDKEIKVKDLFLESRK